MQFFGYKFRKGSCLFSLIKLFLLLVILLGVIVYFFSGVIATIAMRHYTHTIGLNVGLDSLSVDFDKQNIDLKGFYLSNPVGYPRTNALSFDNVYISTDIDFMDLYLKKLLVIKEIRVEGLNLNLQNLQSSDSKSVAMNLEEISKIFDMENMLISKVDGKDGVKFIISKLMFENCKVESKLGDRELSFAMDNFEVEGLGEQEGGLTAQELARQILALLAKKASVYVK